MRSLRNIELSKQKLDNPSLSPFAYCGNNPVMLVDPDGREIWITGDAAGETFSQLQNKSNLKLSINSEGKVEAKGIAWTKADRMIKRASKDQNVKVNIEAKKENSFTWQDGATLPTESGGGYGGNEVENGKVNAFQKVVPSMLSEFDNSVGDNVAGTTMLHELAESYYGGKIAQNEGSSPRQGIVGSTYDRAHNKANNVALGNRGQRIRRDECVDFNLKKVGGIIIPHQISIQTRHTFDGYYRTR
ncbi:MAG: hypothetical protein PHY85_01305 [Bacteroidales bacterium]|nr:hypothetical protein [Bacteroidales bacterium]